jgi:hypothetical protein
MNWMNKHKKILLVAGLAIIIAGGLIFYTIRSANATKQSPSFSTTPNAEALADLNDTNPSSDSSEPDSLAQEPPAPTVISDSESISVSDITDAAEKYLHGGWLHFIKENSSETDRGSKGILDNGAVISANSIWECWMHLDDLLNISDNVCIQTNMDGSIIQVGVRAGNIGWSSATDEIRQDEVSLYPYISDIDGLLRQASRSNAILAIEKTSDEKDQEYFQVSYAAEEKSPVTLWDYNNPVTGSEYIYTFEPETGMMSSFQQWVTFEDGSQGLIEGSVVTVFEYVETPPDEILKYLDKLENK